jgi:hypothetical protein
MGSRCLGCETTVQYERRNYSRTYTAAFSHPMQRTLVMYFTDETRKQSGNVTKPGFFGVFRPLGQVPRFIPPDGPSCWAHRQSGDGATACKVRVAVSAPLFIRQLISYVLIE